MVCVSIPPELLTTTEDRLKMSEEFVVVDFGFAVCTEIIFRPIYFCAIGRLCIFGLLRHIDKLIICSKRKN